MKATRIIQTIILMSFFICSVNVSLSRAENTDAKQENELTYENKSEEMQQEKIGDSDEFDIMSDASYAKELDAIGQAIQEVEDLFLEVPEDYHAVSIREQTVEGIRSHLTIDEAYEEAVASEIPTTKPAAKDENSTPVMTSSEIIDSLISEELRSKKIDLDFDQTVLGDIVLTIGATGDINIVIDPSLRNNQFDLYLKDVTIKEALLLIANSYGLGFKKVEDSLFITSNDKLRDESLISKVIKLKNFDVKEAEALVEDLVESVSSSESINSLMVVGQPENIVKVERLLAGVDIPQPQVLLQAKIVELNKDALKDLGVDWSDSITLSYQESGRSVDFDDPEDSPDAPFKVFSLSRNALQFDTVVRMLENQNKAKVLSNPSITTLNDETAEIFVGDRIPYTVTTVSGGVATTDVRFEEPGIRLTITPSIIEDDFVVLKVEPEVSFIFTFRGPNDEFPQTRKRTATAFVRAKDRMPFVIGGLLNQEDKENLFKVPVIGDVPLLGNLFSYEKHTVIDTELIITVTPTIIHGE